MQLESRPYIKKYNYTEDKAQWSAWQVHLRIEEPDSSSKALDKNMNGDEDEDNDEEEDDEVDEEEEEQKSQTIEKDLFATAVRRKFIPPLMECYQDILVISEHHYNKNATEVEKRRSSKQFLKEVHQKAVDTLHTHTNVNQSIYHVFVTQKADALLMDEQSMDFFEQQLNITPKIAKYACSYVRTIINILRNAEGSQVGFTVEDKNYLESLAYTLRTKMDYLNENDSKIDR